METPRSERPDERESKMDFQYSEEPGLQIVSDDAIDEMNLEPRLQRISKPDLADESVLIEELQAGSEPAFEFLVATQRERMHAVARRFLSEDEDARDAVQDAFLAAYRGIDRFEGQARLSTWLHRVVVNACLMKLRSRRRKPEQSLDEGATEKLVSHFAEDAHVMLEGHEKIVDVRDAILTLPEHHRRVLVLRDLEERDTRETAKVLAISPAAVKTRLHRARAALRTRLTRREDLWPSAVLQQSA